jgi:hypothetical protein
MTSLGEKFKKNLSNQPRLYLTLLLVALGVALIVLALLPGRWWFKVGVAAWVLLP